MVIADVAQVRAYAEHEFHQAMQQRESLPTHEATRVFYCEVRADAMQDILAEFTRVGLVSESPCESA